MRPGLRLVIGCVLACGLDAAVVAAEPAAPVTFLDRLAEAPAVQAARQRVHAAHRGEGAAGRLADPMLSAGLSQRSTAAEAWPIYEVMVEQALPRWGERDARRMKALAESGFMAAELQDVLGETAAEVASMIAEAEAARAKTTLLEGQITRASTLKASLDARIASGSAGLGEQLAVQSRIAALTVERDTSRRQVADAEEEVRARLGLEVNEALPSFAAPVATAVDPERIPGVLLARAKGGESAAMLQEAQASRSPETSIGLRYEREEVPTEPMDTIGLQVRVSLPVWRGASDDLEESARFRQRAARRDEAAARAKARSLVGRAERAATVAASARAAAQSTQGRLDAEYASLIRTAAIQGTGLMPVLEVLDRLGEAEFQVIEAEAAARQAAASLWRLAPPVPAQLPAERVQP